MEALLDDEILGAAGDEDEVNRVFVSEIVRIEGREYTISRFADGVPIVYECRSDDRYGTVLSKFGERAGRSFDASLFKRELCPGIAMIVCIPTES